MTTARRRVDLFVNRWTGCFEVVRVSARDRLETTIVRGPWVFDRRLERLGPFTWDYARNTEVPRPKGIVRRRRPRLPLSEQRRMRKLRRHSGRLWLAELDERFVRGGGILRIHVDSRKGAP